MDGAGQFRGDAGRDVAYLQPIVSGAFVKLAFSLGPHSGLMASTAVSASAAKHIMNTARTTWVR